MNKQHSGGGTIQSQEAHSFPPADEAAMTAWLQKSIILAPKQRGFHVITREVTAQLPELQTLRVGVCHLFIQHTAASIALDERVAPETWQDLEAFFTRLVPENTVRYTHTYEAPDDMPAHIKALLVGSSVTLPITDRGPVPG